MLHHAGEERSLPCVDYLHFGGKRRQSTSPRLPLQLPQLAAPEEAHDHMKVMLLLLCGHQLVLLDLGGHNAAVAAAERITAE